MYIAQLMSSVCLVAPWALAAERVDASLAPMGRAIAPMSHASLGIPFEELARKLLAKYGLDKAAPAAVDLDALLKAHCVRAELGVFEIQFPRGGLDKEGDLLKQAAAALVDAQAIWLDMTPRSDVDPKALRADLTAVQKWVRSWKPAGFKKLDLKEDPDFVAALNPPANVSAAAGRLAAALRGGAASDGNAALRPATRVILMPTRRDFVEFSSLLGWISPENRGQFWNDAVGDWTQCFFFDDQVIALQYAPPGRKDGDFESGIAMNERAPTVLEQQVVQLSLNSYFDQVLGARAPKGFLAGLGMNVVVDQFKEINTRVDGDLRSKVTQATEIFVPGGASEGGVLGINSAESRWRSGHGKDRFIPILRQAQKEGDGLDKKSNIKGAVFALKADDGGKTFAVAAPFWGSSRISDIDLPKEFQGDCAEFLRAYKCGFVHWLRNKSGSNDKASREKFADLLRRVESGEAADFDAAIAAVYEGATLSNADLDKQSLEGRFLAWLAKQP